MDSILEYVLLQATGHERHATVKDTQYTDSNIKQAGRCCIYTTPLSMFSRGFWLISLVLFVLSLRFLPFLDAHAYTS